MTMPLGLGSCAMLKEGYGDFLVGVHYAVVTWTDTDWLVVEIDHEHPARARNLRTLSKSLWTCLHAEGKGYVVPLPEIPRFSLPDEALQEADGQRYKKWKKQLIAYRNDRLRQLQPLIEAAADILSAANIPKRCNEIARSHKLNVTRARALFFTLAAYGFDENALLPGFFRIGKNRSGLIKDLFDEPDGSPAPRRPKSVPEKSPPARTRGRRVKDATITPQGWDFQSWWTRGIKRGWKKHMRPGRDYREAWIETLRTQFHCVHDKQSGRIFHPRGGNYPSEHQFANAVIAWIGPEKWRSAKFGEQTIRNQAGRSLHKAVQFSINLLEELHWDVQLLKELPADPLDPTQPGMAIVRAQVSDVRCGGVVGTGYSYANESQQAYLMALFAMAIDKETFAGYWGVDDITNSEWPAVGVPRGGPFRGDRGPSIARPIRHIVSDVLRTGQEWAASYDPVGKAMAEANHWRDTHIDGKPRTPTVFRSATEIIRDDLRKTRTQFHTSLKLDRLEHDQALRGVIPTASGLWHDLVNRGLYAGQQISFDKIARLTLIQVDVSITDEGVLYGPERYLSPELEKTGLLEQAKGNAIPAKGFVLAMCVGRLWLDYGGQLLELEAVPITFNTLGAAYTLTRTDALAVVEARKAARSRVKQLHDGYTLADSEARARDSQRTANDLATMGTQPSSGPAETHKTLTKLLRRRA